MIQLIFVALCVFVVVHFLRAFQKIREHRKVLNKLPGPDGVPIFGMTLAFAFAPRGKRLQMSMEHNKKYGPLFRSFVVNRAIVHVRQAEAAEVILTSRTNINKAFGYEFLHEWLGTGLLTSTGSKWHTRRKMLTPTFHFSILESFYETFVENGKIFVEKLEKELGSEEFDIFPYINKCALDIICETAMGVKINAQDKPTEYTDAVKDINELLIHRLLRPWLWSNAIYSFTESYKRESKALSILHNMSLNMIKERKQARKQSPTGSETSDDSDLGRKKKKAFLDLLLEISENSSEQLTDSDLREEVDTFMFEGHDTTSAALSWAIFLLGWHPDVQEKVVTEINEVLGTSDSPTMNQLSEMKYTDSVIKECLRLYPAVPFIGRTLTEDTQFGEYRIPAGTIIELNILLLHRNPKYFQNPENFDPENFNAENSRSRHPFAFIPFSAGPRNCIGQKFASLEEKVLLVMFLRRYKVTSLVKPEDMTLIAESILRSEHGMKVKIEKRR